jgi:hypothetical protein
MNDRRLDDKYPANGEKSKDTPITTQLKKLSDRIAISIAWLAFVCKCAVCRLRPMSVTRQRLTAAVVARRAHALNGNQPALLNGKAFVGFPISRGMFFLS